MYAYSKIEINALLKAAESKKSTGDFTKEEMRAIYEACQYGNGDVKRRVWSLIDEKLTKYRFAMMNKYGIIKGDPNYDDCLQDMSLCVCEHLRDWTPSKGKITTFFEPYFRKICGAHRGDSKQFGSRYYKNVDYEVKKAIEHLEKTGVYNPDSLDVKNAIDEMYSTDVSHKTVKKIMSVARDIVSFDSGMEIGVADFSEELVERLSSPELHYSDSTVASVEKLTYPYNEIMKAELRFYEDNPVRKRMTDRELRDELIKNYELAEVTLDWVTRQRSIAERQFYHNKKTHDKRQEKEARMAS